MGANAIIGKQGPGMNTVETLVIVVVAALAVILLARSVKIVPEQWSYVIERLGRYHRTLQAGLRFVVPLIDSVRARVLLSEVSVTLPPQPVRTADGREVAVDLVVSYVITEPSTAVYSTVEYLTGVERQSVAALRYVVGSMNLERVLTGHGEIGAHIAAELDTSAGEWGLQVTHVELASIEFR
jgi:regulator of protease activity HflC (stomatin/prohibitin superfamily)